MGSDPKVIIVDTRNADEYEREAIREIAEWKGKAPSTGSKWLGFAAGPIDAAIRSVLTPETIERAISEANKLAQQGLSAENGGPAALIDADAQAAKSRQWAVGLATAGGAGAGAAGIVGLAVDIPFTVTLALRAIHSITRSYGYEELADSDFALRVLSVSSANNAAEKDTALSAFDFPETHEAPAGDHQSTSRAVIGKEGAVFATRSLAASLAKNLAGRKAAQAIPVVGAAIGAVVSAAFIDEVCTAARQICRERFLRERGILEGPIG